MSSLAGFVFGLWVTTSSSNGCGGRRRGILDTQLIDSVAIAAVVGMLGAHLGIGRALPPAARRPRR